MSDKNVNKITKTDWISNFTLVGRAKINDYTFRIDQRSEKSNWIYNSMNLSVDCGEKFGRVYCELMGGYSADNQNVIYAHGKDENGNDDYKSQVTVDWDDRFDESVLSNIGDNSFIVIGLEKTDKGNTFYKKFLSAYDAIAYVKEHLEDDMIVNVKGSLKYSTYNGQTQVKKVINSIALSKAEDASQFHATFNQSVLIDKNSVSLKNIDKAKSIVYVDGIVLDYMKDYNGYEIRGQFPFNKQFEFKMDFSNEAQCKKIMEKLFKVKKGYTQITFEGQFIEGGATVVATWDDVPDDIKDLVECGIYTEEEALATCSTNGNREQRMVLIKPVVRKVGEDKIPTLQKFDERYSEDDLVIDIPTDDKEEESANGFVEAKEDEDMAWLANL